MKVKELENDKTIQRWKMILNPKPNTWSSYLTGMQHYTEYLDKDPKDLIDSAKAEIKAGLTMDEREILINVAGFRNHLTNKTTKSGKPLAPLSVQRYLSGVYSFYSSYYIDMPKLPRTMKATKKKENATIPDKDLIRQALKHCSIRDKAIVLSGLSSGMGASEVASITLQAFYDGYDEVSGITTLDMRRIKVGVDFVTFLTPEASKAVLEYIQWRDRDSRTGRQVDKEIQAKQRTTAKSYLFIREKVSPEFLKTGDEELRKMPPEAITKTYRRISDNAGLDSESYVYNTFRSHNMRKFFNHTLKHEGFDSERIEGFMGHTLGDTKGAYLGVDVDKLKEIYRQYIPFLTIEKGLDISESEEFKELQRTNKILQTETARHVVERSELAEMKKKVDEMEKMEAKKSELTVDALKILLHDPEIRKLLNTK